MVSLRSEVVARHGARSGAGRRPASSPSAAGRPRSRPGVAVRGSSAIRSCSSREMPFSLAIFSADSPIVRPVDGSDTAGHSGTRSRGRSRLSSSSRARQRPRPLRVDERPREAPAQRDRDVGQAFGPPGDPGLDVPQPYLRGHVGDRLAGGGAGAVHGVGRHFLGQPGAQGHLAGQVGGPDRRHHLPHGHAADPARIDLGALQELPHRGLPQVHGAQVPEGGARAREGRATSSDHGDAAFWHSGLGCGRLASHGRGEGCDFGGFHGGTRA